MIKIIRKLRQPDTIDELCIGSVRDTIANILFPGTTTIQTRAKYMLFVPWILQKMEKHRVPSENISLRVKQEENKLCKSLLKMGFKDGVIGAIVGEGLQRFPSSIYWAGLQTWGIRKFRGSLNDYYQGLNSYYHLKKGNITRDDQEVLLYRDFGENWDEGLPESPEELPGKEGLDLTKNEAQYLLEKLSISCPKSLLTNIIHLHKLAKGDFIWGSSFINKLNHDLQIKVKHAQNFSEIMQGAALVYNYLLAEKKGSEELINQYKERGVNIEELDDQLKKLNAEELDFQIKLGEAISKNEIESILKNYKEQIEDLRIKKQILNTQKNLLLEFSLENSLLNYVAQVITYLSLEEQKEDKWQRMFESLDSFQTYEDEGLINIAGSYSMLLQYI
jgi:hypothetical protein